MFLSNSFHGNKTINWFCGCSVEFCWLLCFLVCLYLALPPNFCQFELLLIRSYSYYCNNHKQRYWLNLPLRQSKNQNIIFEYSFRPVLKTKYLPKMVIALPPCWVDILSEIRLNINSVYCFGNRRKTSLIINQTHIFARSDWLTKNMLEKPRK